MLQVGVWATDMVAVTRSLQSKPGAVSEARAVVRRSMEPSDDDLVTLAVLLVDEVVTNAVVHGLGPIDLAVDVDEERVKVMVGDRSDVPVSPRRAAPYAEGGRGLSIVDAVASRWGVFARVPGKAVWFELDRTPCA